MFVAFLAMPSPSREIGAAKFEAKARNSRSVYYRSNVTKAALAAAVVVVKERVAMAVGGRVVGGGGGVGGGV